MNPSAGPCGRILQGGISENALRRSKSEWRNIHLYCASESHRELGVSCQSKFMCLSDRRLSSIADWQQAIDREGFDLRLDTSRPFAALSGHLPAHRGGEHAGFECDHWDAAETIDG